MREVLPIAAADIAPGAADLLPSIAQGAPAGAKPSGKTAALCEEALRLFVETAMPVGVFQETSPREFASVYNGAGENAERTPLAEIFPRAGRLALFAVTLGPALTERIAALFADRDFALAVLLDAAASEGAERAADRLEALYNLRLAAAQVAAEDRHLLRYSPGYCGWHVRGQRALFGALRPGEIGLSLRESCLMEPLKSISGVIVAGPAAIHDFMDDYEFCANCAERPCRARIRRILDT